MTVPPRLAAQVDLEWLTLSRSVRRACAVVLALAVGLLGWLTVWLAREDQLFSPRAEEYGPALVAAVFAAVALWGLRWSRGEAPFRREVARPGARLSWVALAHFPGPRGRPFVSLRCGFANGTLVLISIDGDGMPLEQRLALGRELETRRSRRFTHRTWAFLPSGRGGSPCADFRGRRAAALVLPPRLGSSGNWR